jgi:hypothetical protein
VARRDKEERPEERRGLTPAEQAEIRRRAAEIEAERKK